MGLSSAAVSGLQVVAVSLLVQEKHEQLNEVICTMFLYGSPAID